MIWIVILLSKYSRVMMVSWFWTKRNNEKFFSEHCTVRLWPFKSNAGRSFSAPHQLFTLMNRLPTFTKNKTEDPRLPPAVCFMRPIKIYDFETETQKQNYAGVHYAWLRLPRHPHLTPVPTPSPTPFPDPFGR